MGHYVFVSAIRRQTTVRWPLRQSLAYLPRLCRRHGGGTAAACRQRAGSVSVSVHVRVRARVSAIAALTLAAQSAGAQRQRVSTGRCCWRHTRLQHCDTPHLARKARAGRHYVVTPIGLHAHARMHARTQACACSSKVMHGIRSRGTGRPCSGGPRSSQSRSG
jgi:hypothetical protein